MNGSRLRVAITLEQCWHEVPGGTASSALETVRALKRLRDVEMLGVAARHDTLPPAPWTPPVIMHQLPLPRMALYESWNYLRQPKVQRATGPVDVIHATTMAIPPKSAPLVVTVHDLAFLQEPAHFTRNGVRFFNRGLKLAQRNADLVLVPSQATFAECVDAGFSHTTLRVVPHGVFVPTVSDRQREDFVASRALPARYVMWCGTLEPRKNVPVLLQAFAIARRSDPELGLVMVGPSGWGNVEVPPDLDGVRLLGFLSRDDLHAAYAGARAFCYPSLREGFGLPVLEAMAHGVPVVTSAGSAMAEFAEGAGILADPRDVDALAAAMTTAAGDRHDELATAAKAKAASYSWENAAALTVAAYHEVAGR
ncbi:MAG: glycosyltransferase family 4 protein [Acidothermaceae bacterium]